MSARGARTAPRRSRRAIRHAAHQPVRREHAEQRHEDRTEQQQEALVGAHVDRERADGRERTDTTTISERCRARVNDVLQAKPPSSTRWRTPRPSRPPSGRQRERSRDSAAGDRGQDIPGGSGRRRATGRAPSRARTGTASATGSRAHAPEGAAAVAREARVVGGERRPGDRRRRHRVDGEPERAVVLAGVRPERCTFGAVEDPPGQVDDRSSTAQIANLRMKRRTKPIGPISASTSAAAPNTIFQSQIASKPNSLSQSRPAAVAIDDQLEDRPAEALDTFSTVAT